MTQCPPTIPNHGRPAFTLIELLVVVTIVIVLIAVTVPSLSLMQESSINSSGVNTVAVAAQAARQLATASSAQKEPLADGGSVGGSAMLVTNTGTIRLLENLGDSVSGLPAGLNGFADIDGRDYINISENVALIGIKRNTAGLIFVAPPFAVRFDEQGSLIFGNVTTDLAYNVYYNGDYDANYEPNVDRPNPYDPNLLVNQFWDTTENRYRVPFERIDTVVGIMVVHAADVPDLTGSYGGYIGANDPADKLQPHDPAYFEILEKGVPVFFNRYTGAPISRSDQQ